MLQDIKDLKAVVNWQGFYDIEVNGVVVGEMIAKDELADYIEWVLTDPEGMVADLLAEEN
jgi:hypothetical protein